MKSVLDISKITAKLNQEGISVSGRTVNNLMNELDISAKLKKQEKASHSKTQYKSLSN